MLNINSCNAISFIEKRKIISIMSIQSVMLHASRVDHIKDLGILLDASLNFSVHIDGITCKAI